MFFMIIKKKLQAISDFSFSSILIQKIRIPSRVIEIGNHAFFRCSNLMNVDIARNSKLKLIGDFAFSYIPAERIQILSNDIRIGKSAFVNDKLK